MTSITLSLAQARRLAVVGQLLAQPRPKRILDVVEHLGSLQLDPTNAVARSEQLVLWSRLGNYDVRELEQALDRRDLFYYWAHIVPKSHFGIHRETMRRAPRGETARARYVREWLTQNATFRRYLLRELRKRGPLKSRDFEDRAAVPWRTGGWNDSRNVGLMLDLLWDQGAITIVGRDGQQRLWDLAERRLPVAEPRLAAREVARRVLESQLQWRGVARAGKFGFVFDGRPPGWERALRELIREGVAVPVGVKGLAGDWFAHADLLEERFRSRTVLLSPFDKLVSNRERTEELFGFRFRLEIYVPKAKRQYGYFVLPVLHGDRLIGRIDPLFDRQAGVLRVNAVHAEPDAPAGAWPSVRNSIQQLAGWIGASEVALPKLPRPWR